jgi:hypothetical protein
MNRAPAWPGARLDDADHVACPVAQAKRSGKSLSAKVLLGNLISGS